jgi:hypothetical protein
VVLVELHTKHPSQNRRELARWPSKSKDGQAYYLFKAISESISDLSRLSFFRALEALTPP